MKLPHSFLKLHKLELANMFSLHFSDFLWYPPEEVDEAHDDIDYRHRGMIAFACTGRRDEWCFYELDGYDEPIVLFCEWAEVGEVYALNFEQALVRVCIEEFGGSMLGEKLPPDQNSKADVERHIRQYAETLKPAISPKYYDLLKGILNDKEMYEEDGDLHFLSYEEAQEIVAKELDFPLLNREFVHDVGSEDYVEMKELTTN